MCFRLLRCDSKTRVWGAPDCRGCISHPLGIPFKSLPLCLPGLQKPLGLYSKLLEETSESFWIPIIIFCDGESSVAWGQGGILQIWLPEPIAGGREGSENGAALEWSTVRVSYSPQVLDCSSLSGSPNPIFFIFHADCLLLLTYFFFLNGLIPLTWL